MKCSCGRDVWGNGGQAAGLCRRCYVRRYNRPVLGPREAAGATRRTATACSYAAAHQRVYEARGKARGYVCPCGRQAETWSYNHAAVIELEGLNRQDRIVTYSGYVWDYDALCRQCHSKRDRKARP